MVIVPSSKPPIFIGSKREEIEAACLHVMFCCKYTCTHEYMFSRPWHYRTEVSHGRLCEKKVLFCFIISPFVVRVVLNTHIYIFVVQKGIEFYSIYHFSPFSFYFQRNLLYHFVKWLFPSLFYFPFPSHSPFIQVIKHLLILFFFYCCALSA